MNNVDCIGCHQLGQESTRTIPAQLGKFESGSEAWMRRIQSGQSGEHDDQPHRRAVRRRAVQVLRRLDRPRRQGRAAEGEAAAAAGRRAQHRVTSWEWSTPDKHYLHDLIASDRRNPTVNAYGPLYGSPEYSTDNMPILDPKTNTGDVLQDAGAGSEHAGVARARPRRAPSSRLQPSAYWGEEKLWDTRANNHNSMFDKKGRVWIAATVRGMDNPAFCKKGSEHPSAKVFPLERSPRQVAMLDPEDDEVQLRRHLLRHASPAVRLRRRRHAVAQRHRPGGGLGQHARCSTRPATRRRRRAGRRSCSTPTATASATSTSSPTSRSIAAKDKRIVPGSGPYAVMPHPTDGSIWYTVGVFAGTPGFLRFDPADGTVGGLQRAEARLRHPRRRHRQERRRLGLGLERPSRAASTGASARARSTGRRRPAITAPRAGRSTSIRARASRASPRPAPRRATTPGSTSTTRSGWARTSRCRRPTSTTASSR